MARPNSPGRRARQTRASIASGPAYVTRAVPYYAMGVPAYRLQVPFPGKLGYEIYCEPQFHLTLWEQMEAAGVDLGLKLYGARALMSLRLEKNWGVWTLDYRPDSTEGESGLDAFIDWSRELIERAAALAERERAPGQKLVSFVVGTPDQDVVGDEAMMLNDECVGDVTSGGYAPYARCSMAMGYVPSACRADGTVLAVEIHRTRHPARVAPCPPVRPECEQDA